ncbi:putative two-component system sensor kinase [Alloactinosynnema sp. L-07]|uniref:sensor histidine kinase n=1 Tax=Alloactinosynnema sp. L-07 TaxID=1653480 RepID=UPI00065EF4BF|nr:ATP-binding protein [Alloactinosynnema sp. L-07]CRK56531.1 putative two-component system sensor kinase [Alloactinosynnema sp. L-07]
MTRTYRHSVERGLQRSYAVMVALFGVTWALSALGTPRLTDGPTASAVALLAAAWTVQLVRGWRTALGPVDVLTTSAAAVVVSLAMGVEAARAVPAGTRVQPVVVAAAAAAGFLPWRAAVAVVAGLTAAYCAGFVAADGVPYVVIGLWPMFATAVAAGVVAPLMRSAGDAADRSQQATERAMAEAAAAEGRRTAHREFQRTLHDHVSAALRGLATGGLASTHLRAACGRAVDALRSAPRPFDDDRSVGLAAALVDQASATRTPVELDLDHTVTAPTPVAHALAQATGELLRNVDKHADASVARVVLRRRREGLEVAVRDDGRGLQGPVDERSVGLRRSVVERVDEVGGTVKITSRPGAGVAVTLRWTPTATATGASRWRRADLLTFAVGDIRRPLAMVNAPFLVGNTAMSLVYAGHSVGTAVLVGWNLLLVGLTLALIAKSHHGVDRTTSAVVAVAAVGWVAVALPLMPPDSISSYASWPVGAITPVFVVLATLRPAWEPIAAHLTELTVLFVLISVGTLTVPSATALLPAILSPLFGLAMGIAIGRTIAGLGAVVHRERAAQQEIVTTQAHRDGRAAVHGRRMAEIGNEVEPFLQAVADGTHSPLDTDVRMRADALDQAARDELRLPGVLDPAARNLLAAARAGGCAVAFHADSDAVDIPHSAATMIRSALRHPPPDRLTLSVYPENTAITIVMVLAPGDSERTDRLRADVAHFSPAIEETPEETVIEITCDATAAAP